MSTSSLPDLWQSTETTVTPLAYSGFEGSDVCVFTWEERHHRFILAEKNTHGHAKSSASSRARPTKKMVAEALTDIAFPVQFGTLMPGMQAGPPLAGDKLAAAEWVWVQGALHAVQTTLSLLTHPLTIAFHLNRRNRSSMADIAGFAEWGSDPVDTAVAQSELLGFVDDVLAEIDSNEAGQLLVHKQVANRPLEPYMWHTAVQTAHLGRGIGAGASIENMLAQRCTPTDGSKALAQPEFYVSADRIAEALAAATLVMLDADQWHLPYIRDEDRLALVQFQLAAIAVARCARVSYVSQNGVRELDADADMFENRLASAHPPHWAPFEHVLRPYPGTHLGRIPDWQSVRHLPAAQFELMREANRKVMSS